MNFGSEDPSGLTRRALLQSAMAAPLAAQGRRPNVLTIISDQLNAGVMSVYGGPVSTPNIERLARRGVLFRNATCPTPFCSPSRASIVTGQYPHRHGVAYNVSKIDYPKHPFLDTEEGLFESDTTADKILNHADYSTHQYGKWHLSGDRLSYYPDPYGEHHEYAREMADAFAEAAKRPPERRMDWYGWMLPVVQNPEFAASFSPDEPFFKGYTGEFIYRMGRLEFPEKDTFDYRVANRTIQRLGKAGSAPFSITCSLNWPHDPNVAPSPWYEQSDPRKIEFPANYRVREARFNKDVSATMVAKSHELRLREFLRIYHATVRFIDHQVGCILDELERLKLLNDTIVIFTADHGDMAGGHGMAWKSTQAFYDEVARIPMIVSWPGRIQPGRTDAAASLVDLGPTILDLTGHKPAPSMDGNSLAPVLLGKSSGSNLVFGISERIRAGARRMRALPRGTGADLMIRGEGWKYCVHGNETYLYDLKKDPGETRNLAAEPSRRSVRDHLHQELGRYLERTGYPGGRPNGFATA